MRKLRLRGDCPGYEQQMSPGYIALRIDLVVFLLYHVGISFCSSGLAFWNLGVSHLGLSYNCRCGTLGGANEKQLITHPLTLRHRQCQQDLREIRTLLLSARLSPFKLPVA